MSILANSPDLTKIINKAIKRIGENHALARDNKGVEMKSIEIEEDRKEFRKGRTNEIANETMDSVIEESLKAVADEMAEKMVLENTIDGMIKDVIQEQETPDSSTIDESTTHTIKKLVNKKLKDKIAEARGGFSTSKHPGLDTYEKAAKKSKTENDKAMKDTEKKFKEYDTFEGSESPEFPHQENSKTNADGQFQYYRNTEEDQEFVDDFAHPGLIDYDINNLNLDRLTKYLEGSSETGNAQTDKDGNGLGNVVPSDLGKKMMKSAENRKEKIAQQKASMSNLRGYTPDVQKVKQVKEGTEKDMDKMKKLWSYNKNTQ
tara:strand:+ start:510 stop:1463 length:954 start_codon:yes stop_codon:yes gene_type:complete